MTNRPQSLTLLPSPTTDPRGSTDGCCADGCAFDTPGAAADDATSVMGGRDWQRARRWAIGLAWASLASMTVEGAAGLVAGTRAGSVALTRWALGSVVEGLASVIVI
jgi:hypothetical protein